MPLETSLGSPTASAVTFFLIIVALTLAITWWAARRTKSTSEFYAAGRSVTALEIVAVLSRVPVAEALIEQMGRDVEATRAVCGAGGGDSATVPRR